jgi:hypothetical protein
MSARLFRSARVFTFFTRVEELRECIVRDFTCLRRSGYGRRCIQDASYVLCPVCQVVSPAGGGCDNDRGVGGIGLGFTLILRIFNGNQKLD